LGRGFSTDSQVDGKILKKPRRIDNLGLWRDFAHTLFGKWEERKVKVFRNMYVLVLVAFLLCGGSVDAKSKKSDASELVVYSARIEKLIQPLFKAYEKETGVKVRSLTAKAAPLIEKLKAEGANSPADLLITVDAGNLYQAEKMGLFSPVSSKTLDKNIPSHLRSSKKKWFGLSLRARSIFYNPSKVSLNDLKSYENLADPRWDKQLCLRTSKKVYNKSLVATMILHNGVKETEKVVKGWVKNLAAPVFTSDSKLLKAIAAGQCSVGIANTYYYGRLLKEDPKINLKIFWPNQKDRGAHVNVSGAGVLKSSKNKKQAIHFLEWLSKPKAQKIFAEANLEFPVNKKVKASQFEKQLGPYKADQISLGQVGEMQSKATMLMDRAGYL
jgi:iron(III) transport system substrate-binding protein